MEQLWLLTSRDQQTHKRRGRNGRSHLASLASLFPDARLSHTEKTNRDVWSISTMDYKTHRREVTNTRTQMPCSVHRPSWPEPVCGRRHDGALTPASIQREKSGETPSCADTRELSLMRVPLPTKHPPEPRDTQITALSAQTPTPGIPKPA